MATTARDGQDGKSYQGNDQLILAIVLAVITFWLFAQTTLNVAPVMRDELQISDSVSNIAVSITALFGNLHRCSGWACRPAWPNKADQNRLGPQHGGFVINRHLAGQIRDIPLGWTHHPGPLSCVHHARDASTDESLLWRASSPASVELLVYRVVGRIRTVRAIRRLHCCNDRVAMDLLDVDHRRSAELVVAHRNPRKQSRADEFDKRFDWIGLFAFVVAMVALNVIIGQGSELGWLSPTLLALLVVFFISAVIFFKVENRTANSFVDLKLFKDKTL